MRSCDRGDRGDADGEYLYWQSIREAADSVNSYGMTETETERSEEIENALSEDEREGLTDKFMALRHLRAEKGDAKKAVAAVRRTLKWRDEFRVQNLRRCLRGIDRREGGESNDDEKREASNNDSNDNDVDSKSSEEELMASVVRKENETGKLYVRGYDKDGRAMMYMRPGKENTRDEGGNMLNLVYHMEKAIACSAKNGRSKLCIVVDYGGFLLRNAPPMSTSKFTLDLLQKHYPERLFRAYICNPPWIFDGFWKVIQPFIDPVTKEKIQFCTSERAFEKVAQDMGGPERAKRCLEACAGGEIDPSDFDTVAYCALPLEVSFGEPLR